MTLRADRTGVRSAAGRKLSTRRDRVLCRPDRYKRHRRSHSAPRTSLATPQCRRQALGVAGCPVRMQAAVHRRGQARLPCSSSHSFHPRCGRRLRSTDPNPGHVQPGVVGSGSAICRPRLPRPWRSRRAAWYGWPGRTPRRRTSDECRRCDHTPRLPSAGRPGRRRGAGRREAVEPGGERLGRLRVSTNASRRGLPLGSRLSCRWSRSTASRTCRDWRARRGSAASPGVGGGHCSPPRTRWSPRREQARRRHPLHPAFKRLGKLMHPHEYPSSRTSARVRRRPRRADPIGAAYVLAIRSRVGLLALLVRSGTAHARRVRDGRDCWCVHTESW